MARIMNPPSNDLLHEPIFPFQFLNSVVDVRLRFRPAVHCAPPRGWRRDDDRPFEADMVLALKLEGNPGEQRPTANVWTWTSSKEGLLKIAAEPSED